MGNHICSDKKLNVSVVENMENGVSYVTIYHGHDEIKLPIEAFRYINSIWNKKGWDKQWDTLAVTDDCFSEEE
jgi:hypothetical protein